MYNVRLSPCGANGDKKAAKCNRGLGGSMVSVKCGFRLECFSTLMFFLTNIVAAFYLEQQKKLKKTSQMKQVHWKTFLVYLVSASILNTT